MKKSIVVIALFTISSQGVIYAVIHNVDLLVSVVVACIFVVQGLAVYVLTDRESFQNGLEASKESNKVETLVSRQVTAALGLVKENTKKGKGGTDAAPATKDKVVSFHELEITGLD